jgi:hypothetical protein
VLWYVTDSEYRKRYRAEMSRVRAFRAAQKAAWPAVWAETGGVVASGPFVGMKYVRTPGRFNQKILGTYEKELHGIVETLCHPRVVDLGAAEGYYVCGFARRNGAKVVAFESQAWQRRNLARMARANGVEERVRVLDTCTVESLREVLSPGALVVCDVDGGESELLDPARVPELLGCDLLVEAHDGIVPGVSRLLSDRFSGTHDVTPIRQAARTLEDLPARLKLDPRLALAAITEFRGAQNGWLWIKRREKVV